MAHDKPASERELQPARAERRSLSLEDISCRVSGDTAKGIYMNGHAAVFDRLSLDLGGFREKIEAGAFAKVLEGEPDVRLVWDHDGKRTLARTSGSYMLSLEEDSAGLSFRANVAPTSYAKDLALLMEGRTIDQGSFAFTVAEGGDSWKVDDDGNVERTITEVDGLYDVTITGQGAYPQTDTAVAQRSLAAFCADRSIEIPEIPDQQNIVRPEAGETPSQDMDRAADNGFPHDLGDEQERTVTDESPGTEASLDEVEGDEERVTGLHDLQQITRVELELAKRRLLEADRKLK